MNSQHRDVKTAMDRLQRVFGHKPSRSSVMSGLYDLKQGAREDYRKFSGRFERVLGDLRDFSAPIPPDETLNDLFVRALQKPILATMMTLQPRLPRDSRRLKVLASRAARIVKMRTSSGEPSGNENDSRRSNRSFGSKNEQNSSFATRKKYQERNSANMVVMDEENGGMSGNEVLDLEQEILQAYSIQGKDEVPVHGSNYVRGGEQNRDDSYRRGFAPKRDNNRNFPPRRDNDRRKFAQNLECHGCGRKGHIKATCRAKVVCKKCGKNRHWEKYCNVRHKFDPEACLFCLDKGHFYKKCPNRTKENSDWVPAEEFKANGPVSNLMLSVNLSVNIAQKQCQYGTGVEFTDDAESDVDGDRSDSDDIFPEANIHIARCRIMCDNGQAVTAIADSGASVTLVSQE